MATIFYFRRHFKDRRADRLPLADFWILLPGERKLIAIYHGRISDETVPVQIPIDPVRT